MSHRWRRLFELVSIKVNLMIHSTIVRSDCDMYTAVMGMGNHGRVSYVRATGYAVSTLLMPSKQQHGFDSKSFRMTRLLGRSILCNSDCCCACARVRYISLKEEMSDPATKEEHVKKLRIASQAQVMCNSLTASLHPLTRPRLA